MGDDEAAEIGAERDPGVEGCNVKGGRDVDAFWDEFLG